MFVELHLFNLISKCNINKSEKNIRGEEIKREEGKRRMKIYGI